MRNLSCSCINSSSNLLEFWYQQLTTIGFLVPVKLFYRTVSYTRSTGIDRSVVYCNIRMWVIVCSVVPGKTWWMSKEEFEFLLRDSTAWQAASLERDGRSWCSWRKIVQAIQTYSHLYDRLRCCY